MARLATVQGMHIVVSGFGKKIVKQDNLTSLPYESGFYHPDLVVASDAVVAKLGYSTLAEVFHAGLPYAYVTRERFRESQILEVFVQNQMSCRHIAPRAYPSGGWVAMLPELASLERVSGDAPNGADQIAAFLDGTLRDA